MAINKDFLVKNGLQVGGNASVTGSLTASGLQYPVSDGDQFHAIVTDGAGSLSFQSVDTVESDVTNHTGFLIPKGTPVYQTGAAGNTLTIAMSDASDPATMPAIGVAASDIADGSVGRVIHFGPIKGVDTSSFTEGDRIYVAVGGGYQVGRPSGEGNVVQFLGVVTKVHATNGSGVVFGGGRSMAVPNLDEGNVFVGDANNLPVTATLDTDLVAEGTNLYYTDARAITAIQGAPNLTINGGDIYVDTAGHRVGIGDTSPQHKLDVAGGIGVGGTEVITSTGQIVTAQLQDSGVTAGAYGSGSDVPIITVDAKGRVTSLTTASVAGVTGFTYDAGTGVLNIATADGGSFDATVNLSPFSTTDLAEGTNLYYTDARARASLSASDGITYNSSTGAFTLTDTGVVSGSYGSASQVPVINVDANGRITSASTTAVAGVSSTSYNTSTGVLTINTSDGGSFTEDLGVGTSDSPTFNAVSAYSLTTTDGVSVGGSITIDGDLTVNGTTTTVNADNLAIADNFIYLNDGNTTANLDLGWAGNYNDGTYAHTGLFRDATDGRFKVFDSYTPEPGTAIDVSHASFNFADMQAGTFYGNLSGNVTGNVTGTVSSILNHSTTDLSEGTNLYYTNARVQGVVTKSYVDGLNVDADTLDGAHLASITHSGDTVTLTGDVTGSTTVASDGSISITTAVGNDSHSHSNYVLKAGDTMTGRLIPDTSGDYDQISVTSLTNAPIYYPEVNVGSADTYLPAFHMRASHSGGYRTHMNVGLHKDASGWGNNSTGFYVALGGNDGYPTENYKLTYGGQINHSVAGRFFADNYHPNADKWTTARTLTLTGDVTGSVSMDGSGNVSMTTAVADDSHNHSSSSGNFTVNGDLFVDEIRARTNQDLTITAGESYTIISDGTYSDEYIRLGAENGVIVYSSTDNLTSGLNRSTTLIDTSGNMSINSGNLSVSGTVTASAFYDSNNASYYVNPASFSNLTRANFVTDSRAVTDTNRTLNIDGNYTNGAYTHRFRKQDLGGGVPLFLDFTSGTANSYTALCRFGTYSGNGYEFEVFGDISASGEISASSDSRLKENVELVTDAVNKVKAIRGVTFTRNDKEDAEKRYAGVIAQEVEAVLPEVVSEDENGMKSVSYGNMVSLLIEAIKEQQGQIDELKKLLEAK